MQIFNPQRKDIYSRYPFISIMGWTDSFKKARRDREDIFLEYTDEELDRYNKYRTRMIICIIVGLLFSWTGVGLLLLIVCLIHYNRKMGKIRTAVYRRYLKKKRQKEEQTAKKKD